VIKKILLLALYVAAFTACKKDGESSQELSLKDDVAFTAYEGHFLDELWKNNPDWATSVGYHKYDSVLLIPNAKTREQAIKFAKVQMDSLSRYEVNSLNDANKMDHRMMQNQMESLQWHNEQLKAYEWDPSSYNVIGTFAAILNEPYAPLTKRLRSFYQKMAEYSALL
jgi:hypothetical protein